MNATNLAPASTATVPDPAEPIATPADLPSPTPEPPLAALVNGQSIYLADYERELGRYESSLLSRGIDPSIPEGQENLAQARDWVLNVMIEQVLTEQAATAAGVIIPDADVDAYMQEIIACHHVSGEASFIIQVLVDDLPALESVVDHLSPFGQTQTAIVLSTPVDKTATVPLFKTE